MTRDDWKVTIPMLPKPTKKNTMNLSEYRKRFVKSPTPEQQAASKKYYADLQNLIRQNEERVAAEKAKNAEPIRNEQPCGCHDDPRYGHVVMADCTHHD